MKSQWTQIIKQVEQVFGIRKRNTVRKREQEHCFQIEKLEDRMMLNGDVGDLVFSASFEEVNVQSGGFAFFREVSGLTATQGAVEVQRNHPSVGPASEGAQHLELDGTNGVFVDLEVASGDGLTLRFDYSPRPGVGAVQNAIEVYWDGSLLETISRDGTRHRSTDFKSVEIELPTAMGRLEFRSNSPDDGFGLGGLIDNVQVFNNLTPLQLASIGDQDVVVDSTVNISASLLPPNENLNGAVYSLVDAPVGMQIDPATGQITWTATQQQIDDSDAVNQEQVIRDPELEFQAGFEDVDVISGGYGFFTATAGFTTTGGAFEVQDNHPSVGPASQGSQHVELDGVNGIFRDVTTVTGDQYELVLDYSPRPGVDASGSEIEVWWDGQLLDKVSADGTRLRKTRFQEFRFDLSTFSGDLTRLEFRSNDPQDAIGLGGLLDNVRVYRSRVEVVGEGGKYNVTVMVTDSRGRTDTEQFAICLQTSNAAAPVLGNIGNQTVPEETQLTLTVAASDIDSTQSQLTFELTAAPAGASIDASSGEILWTPVESQGPGTFSFEVRVTDQTNLSDSVTFDVTVEEVNQAPVLAQINDQTVTEGQALAFTVMATDADLPANALVYSIASGPAGVTVNATSGQFQWTPTEEQAGLSHDVTIQVSDGAGGTDSQTFSIAIEALPDRPPVLTSVPYQTVNEGELLTLFLTATDPDTPTDQLTFELVSGPKGILIDSSTGQLTWTPTEQQGPVEYDVKVKVTDETSLVDSKNFKISVAEVNQAPVIAAIEDQAIADGESITVTVTATDADLPSNTLIYSVASGPEGATIDSSTGQFGWTPTSAQTPGVYDVVIGVSDGAGGTDTETFEIRVSVVNEAPVFSAIADQSIDEGTQLSVQAVATDADQPPQPLTYSLSVAPNGATIESQTGLISWVTGEPEGPGTYDFTVVANDGAGGTDDESFQVTVNEVNIAPVIAAIPNQTVEQGNLLEFTASATDADTPANTLTFGLSGTVPAGLAINPSTGLVSWTPTDTTTLGDYSVIVTVSDGKGASDMTTVAIAVTATTAGILLVEGQDFETVYSESLEITADTNELVFEFTDLFDTADPDSINDAFEVALLDENGNSLVHTITNDRDSFFNLTENQAAATGVNTVAMGQTVKLDLSHIAEGTTANLVFRLINNDDDTQTQVRITSIETTDNLLNTPVGASFAALATQSNVDVDFVGLTDVTGSVQFEYGQSSFDAESSTLYADVHVANNANHPIDGPFLLVVHSITDPNVVVVGSNGVTPEGDRYFLMEDSTGTNTIESGASTLTQTLEFFNPSGQQFGYELTVLAQPNTAPEFVTTPNKEGEAGVAYTYQANATDADSDDLVYELMAGPTGLAVDAETGLINWTPELEDIGTHSVILEVADGRGGKDMQQYDIEVVEDRPNRPPVIISTPVVETYLPSPEALASPMGPSYVYNVVAVDPDVDPVTYQLDTAPTGMTIDSATGLISWTPTSDQADMHTVIVTANDGQGGTATQEYQLRVLADSTNTDPVIISDPVDDFFVPGFSNPTSGMVAPQRISLDLGNGQTFDGTVSITLPDDAARFADIVLAVDESGSMADDQAWVAGMIPLLDDALKAQGIGSDAANPNRFAVVGFGGGREGITVGHFLNQDRPTKYTLYGPGNEIVAEGAYNAVVPDELLNLQLPDDGRYVLVIEAANSSDLVGGIDIGIEGQWGTSVRSESLVLGEIVDDRLSQPGQPVEYNFTLTTLTPVYFDSLAKDPRVRWTLSGPGGQVVAPTQFNLSDVSLSDPVQQLAAGEYTLTVFSNTDVNADYRFRLIDLTTAPEIASGETINGEFIERNETFVYRLNVTAGQRFQLINSITEAESGSKWRLIDPNYGTVTLPGGATSRTLGTNQSAFPLAATGEYYLLYESTHTPQEGNSQVRGPMQFDLTVSVLDAVPPTALTIGNTVNGSIDFVGDFDQYSFSLATRTNVSFDSLVENTLAWSLAGPAGTSSGRFRFSDSLDGDPVMDLVAGDYILQVDSNGIQGAYVFRLMDIATGIDIIPGTPFDGEFTVPNETDIYRFNANAGDQFFVDIVAASDQGSADYKIYDQLGRLLYDSPFLLDYSPLSIPTDGTYSLLVEGRSFNVDADTYSINIVPIVSTTQALTLSSVVNGTLATPGETAVYKFALGSDTQLYFDSLTNDFNLRWSLEGPRGEEVSELRFDLSDSNSRADASIDARQGDWRLTVSANADYVGDFSFTLSDILNPAHSTPITPNPGTANPSVTITPAAGLDSRQTQIFRFNADAGDEFDFVTNVTGSINSYYRLLDQNGTEIIPDTYLSNDQLNEILPASGIYYLLVEPRISNADLDDWSIDIKFVQNNGATTFSGSPLALGVTTSGDLNSASQVDAFTFSVTDRSVLYFDSLTDSGAVRWNLTGPTGAIVSNRAFNASDSFNFVDVTTELIPGDYLLEVFATSGTPGAYDFRLHDAVNSTEITPGTSFDGTLDPANETHLYKFDATAGDTFYFDVEATSDINNTHYKLIDPFGRRVFTSNQLNDFGEQTTEYSGTYTLLVESWRANTGTDTYTMNVHKVPAASETPLNMGDTMTGAFSTPGEQAIYTFSVADDTQVHFDSLTNSSIYNWTLSNEFKTIVNGRRFNRSDSWEIGPSVIELVPGDYRLTVAGIDETQDYSFRLLDVANSTTITPGTPTTSVHTNTKSTQVFDLAVQAGDTIYFDAQNSAGFSSSGTWRLFDPYGNEVFQLAFSQDDGPRTFDVAGTYRILVEGRISDTGADGEFVFDIVPLGNVLSPTSPTSIAVGDVVNGDTSVVFETDRYAFSLTQESLVYFDSFTNDTSLNWTLTNGTGVLVSARSFRSSDSSANASPVLNLRADNYVLSVTSSAIEPYSFRLQNLADASLIAIDSPLTGEFTTPNETDMFRFVGTEGEQIYLDVISDTPASNAYMRLVDEFGGVISTQTTMTDQDVIALPRTGTYYLLLEARGATSVSSTYEVNVVSASKTLASLTLGDTQSGEIAAIGDTTEYSFTLPSNATLYFDSLTNSSTIVWSLTGPGGSSITKQQFGRSDSFNDQTPLLKSLPAGDYTLTVDGTADNIGTFSFRLLDIATNFTPLTVGTPITGELTIPNQTNVYRFDASAGDQFLVDWLAADDTNNSLYRIFDPLDNEIFELPDLIDGELEPLAATGTFTLLVEGRRSNVGLDAYQFNLVDTNTRTVAINVGDNAIDSIATPGERVDFTFNVDSDSFLYLDSLTDNSQINWSLTGPTGELFSQRLINRSDSLDLTTPVFEARAGSYTLTVDADIDVTGAFSFGLLDVADGTVVTLPTTLGEAVTIGGIAPPPTLDPGISTDVYRFDANAGDNLTFDSISATNSNAYYRVVDPFGKTLFTRALNGDQASVDLDVSGTHTLLIEGRFNATVANEYRLNVIFNGNTSPDGLTGIALPLGITQTGDLNTAGQTDSYQFTLTDRSLLHMDVLTNSSSFRWSLRGPRSVEITNLAFTSTDSQDSSTSNIDLIAGDYQLDIFATNSTLTPGAYGFTLHNFANATPITPGVAFSGELTNPAETDLYQFTANAGDRFLIDVVTTNDAGRKEFKLIDRYGTVVVDSISSLRDIDDVTIPRDGTYTLLVEGYRTNTGTDTYELNIVPIVTATRALTPGVTNSTALTTGSELEYTFDITDPSLLIFTPQTDTNLAKWTLTSELGEFVSSRDFDDGVLSVDLPSGNYMLTVDGVNDYAGGGEFTVLIADAANVLANGVITHAELTETVAATAYQFNGSAGQHFSLLPDLNMQFADSATSAVTAGNFTASAEPEDGWSGIDVARRADLFREGAAINYILVTDEERDNQDDNLSFAGMFQDLSAQEALLNVVVSTAFRDENNDLVLGVDSDGNAYKADGAGGFTVTGGGFAASPFVSVKQDYLDLAFALDGAAWNLNLLRSGGVEAESFTSAFVDVKVAEILKQTALRLIPSNLDADFEITSPDGGVFTEIVGGETYDFDVRVGINGQPLSYDLLFTQGQTVGSIPVFIVSPYEYGASAVDADGDTLTWSLVTGPEGLFIDSANGVLTWPVDGVIYGEHDVTIRVEDGRGGFDEQTFVLDVNGGEAATVRGRVFNSETIKSEVYLNGTNISISLGDSMTSEPFTNRSTEDSLRSIVDLPTADSPEFHNQGTHVWVSSTPLELNFDFGQELDLKELHFWNYFGEGFDVDSIELNYFDRNMTPLGSSNISPALGINVGGLDTTPILAEQIELDVQNVQFFNAVLSGTNGQVDFNNLGFTAERYELLSSFDVISTNPYTSVLHSPLNIGSEFFVEDFEDGSFDLDGVTLSQGLITSSVFPDQVDSVDGDDGVIDASGSNGDSWFSSNGAAGITISFDAAVLGQLPKQAGIVWTDGAGEITFRAYDASGDLIDEITSTNADSVNTGETPEDTFFGSQNSIGISSIFISNASGGIELDHVQYSFADPFTNDTEPWTVFLDQNRNGIRESNERFTETDAVGRYSFTNLAAGTYTVAQEANPGWQQTIPTIRVHEVSLDPGEDLGGLLFGNRLVPIINTDPKITSDPTITIVAGESYDYSPTIEELDGDTLTFDTPLAPVGLAVNPNNGTIRWTPRLDQIGTQNVLLRVRDGNGGFDLQYFQIEVAEPNSAPVITSTPPTGPAGVGLPYQYDVNAVDAQEDAFSFSLNLASEGMTIDETTGIIQWTPAVNQLGVETITVVVLDERGLSSEQTFELTVELTPENIDPIFLSDAPIEVRLGDNYLYRVQTFDQNGDPTTLTLDEAPDGMTLDSNGLIVWIPGPNQLGEQTVRLIVEDGRGGTATQEFTLEVKTQPVNFPPEITSIPLTAAIAGESYLFQPTAEDRNNDTLFWTLENAPMGMTIDPLSGQINWEPGTEEIGVHDVTVQVMDTYAAFSQLVYKLRVRAVNTPPVILTAPNTSGAVGSTYLYQVGAEDVDQDRLTFTLVSGPSGLSIDANTGLVQWTPAAGQDGSADVEIAVSDSLGASVSQVYTIVVADGQPNQLPVITSTPGFFATANGTYTYQIVAEDPDGDVITYTLLSPQTGMTVNSTTGLLEWTPTTSDLGTTLVEVVARDPALGGSIQQFSLTVLNANNAPVINSTPLTDLASGQPFRYDVLANDADGDFLNYELINGPEGFVIDGLGRTFWIPGADQLGDNSIEINVTDPRGAFATQSFTVNVATDTTAPQVAVNLSDNPVDVGSMVDIRVQAIDNVGVETLVLTVDGVAVPLDANGNARIDLDTVGSFTALATATDAAGNSATDSVQIFVADPNDVEGPVISITTPADGDSITAPTDIIGSVMDDTLVSYRLWLAEFGLRDFKEIGSGTENVDDGVLGKLDPTLLQNGSYILRLEAIDAGGNGSVIEQAVEIAGELKLGDFQITVTDMLFQFEDITIPVNRVYNSLSSNDDSGDIGFGWSLDYRDIGFAVSVGESGLEDFGIYTPFAIGTRVYISLPEIGRVGFTFDPSIQILPGFGNSLALATPRFIADDGVNARLEAKRSGHLFINDFGELNAGGGIPWNPMSPDFGGGLNVVLDNGLTYGIGTDGKISTINNRSGNTVVLSETGFEDDRGSSIEFERDASGKIVRVDGPGTLQVQYHYDQNGDLVGVEDELGNVTRYEYSDVQAHFLDSIIDPLGRPSIRVDYDANGRVSAITDAEGNRTAISSDPDSKLETFTAANGAISVFAYDDRGNLIEQVDPFGSQTKFEFDNNNNNTSIVDPLGNRTEFQYDSGGRVTSQKSADGSESRKTYNRFGQPLSQIDELGNTNEVTYQNNGAVDEITTSDGVSYKLESDGAGNILGVAGGVSFGESTYDARGNVIAQAESATNYAKTFEYDPQGRLLKETIHLDDEQFETIFTYDLVGRLTKLERFDGYSEAYSYNSADEVVSIKDSFGNITRFQRDNNGQVIAEILPDATPGDLADNPTNRFTYDSLGNRISIMDPEGNTTYLEYDLAGRIVKTTLADSTPGDLTDNPQLSIEYDAAGRVIAEIDARGSRTEYEYNSRGNRISVKDPTGAKTTFEYDSANRLTKIIDPLGRETVNTFDSLGRPTGTTLADGTNRAIAGSIGEGEFRSVSPGGSVETVLLDSQNRIASIEDALGGKVTFEYDPLGNITIQSNPERQQTEYKFDVLGRRVGVELSGGESNSTEYDAAGRISKLTDFAGRTTTLSYDILGRVEKLAYADESETSFAYNLNGDVLSVTEAAGVSRFEHNARGQITKKTDVFGQVIEYEYDNSGNVLQVKTSTREIENEYNATNQLLSVKEDGVLQVSYTYDLVGNITGAIFANGASQIRTYDSINQVIKIEDQFADGSSQSVDYEYDLNGNVTNKTFSDGDEQVYQYDGLNRIVAETSTTEGTTTEVNYTYDRAGNRLTKTHNGTISTYSYDGNGRLVSLSNSLETRTFEYDANGNLTSEFIDEAIVKSYQWDVRGRLTGIDLDGDGTLDQVRQYDFDNQLIADSGKQFLVDSNRRYSQIIEEFESGTSVNQYLYGVGLVAQQSTGDVEIFIHRDRIGTTVSTSDSTGEENRDYRYDSFGNRLDSSIADTSILFAGERSDAASGLTYLRSRYLSSELGRFVSQDNFDGLATITQSLNRYTYVRNNPVNLVDPSGQTTLVEQLATMKIQTVVTKLSQAVLAYQGVDKSINTLSAVIVITGATFQTVLFSVMVYTADTRFLETDYTIVSVEAPIKRFSKWLEEITLVAAPDKGNFRDGSVKLGVGFPGNLGLTVEFDLKAKRLKAIQGSIGIPFFEAPATGDAKGAFASFSADITSTVDAAVLKGKSLRFVGFQLSAELISTFNYELKIFPQILEALRVIPDPDA